ncbi:MAG: hypothetical protein QOF24_1455 [Verrucomicrobiota bacterium]
MSSPVRSASSAQCRPAARSRPLANCRIDCVLVPLDFSHASLKALKYALALVNEFGAQLHVVHVCESDHTPSTFEAISLVSRQSEVVRRSRRLLRDLVEKQGVQFAPDHLHVLSGRTYHEICDLAQRLAADLIVTSTRGLTGLKHVLLGSTAERVVQHAPCPVLIVREREHDFVGMNGESDRAFQLKKIVVPFDFSECSIAGLEFAVPFAHFWNAQVVLFNSVPVTSFTPYAEFGVRDLTGWIAVRAAAEDCMRTITSDMLERGVAVEPVIQIGPPARQICDYADRHEADLIVMSTHGSTGLAHALLGSVAEHVVRYAHCPVLVVPTREQQGDES